MHAEVRRREELMDERVGGNAGSWTDPYYRRADRYRDLHYEDHHGRRGGSGGGSSSGPPLATSSTVISRQEEYSASREYGVRSSGGSRRWQGNCQNAPPQPPPPSAQPISSSYVSSNHHNHHPQHHQYSNHHSAYPSYEPRRPSSRPCSRQSGYEQSGGYGDVRGGGGGSRHDHSNDSRLPPPQQQPPLLSSVHHRGGCAAPLGSAMSSNTSRSANSSRRKPAGAHYGGSGGGGGGGVAGGPSLSSSQQAANVPRQQQNKPQHRVWELCDLIPTVRKTILESLRIKVIAGFKELEEDLAKLRYVKSRYNYLEALDELMRNKEIFIINEKPEVFCLTKEPRSDLLEQFLHDYREAKLRDAAALAAAASAAATTATANATSNNNTTPKTSPLSPDHSKTTNKQGKGNEMVDKSKAASEEPVKCCSCNCYVNNNSPAVSEDQVSSCTPLVPGVSKSSKASESSKEVTLADAAQQQHNHQPQNKIVVANIFYANGEERTRSKRKRRGRKGADSNKENAEQQSEETATPAQITPQTISTNNTAGDRPTTDLLKSEHSSQLSSSNSELSETEPECLPDSEIYPSEYIFQKVTEIGFDCECIVTRFANWNRSPVSALNEFAQICHFAVKLEITDSSGPDHAKL